MDAYGILGVDRSASFDVIKRRYRALLLKCHPDKDGGDPAILASVKEAYDRLKEANAGANDGANDGDRRPRKRIRHTPYNVECTLEELFAGATKRVELNVYEPCDCGCDCEFSPACPSCRGSGVDIRVAETSEGRAAASSCTQCAKCAGSGSRTKCEKCASRLKCPKCEGTLLVSKKGDTVDVRVEPGAAHRDVYEIADDRYVIRILEMAHATYERCGDDLIFRKTMTISLIDALCGGFSVSVKHLDGSNVCYPVPAGTVTRPGLSAPLAGLGMPRNDAKGTAERGDLYVRFDVEFPIGFRKTSDAKRVREALREALR